ncbi:MAG: flavodoxin domain-containing protein, partial [Planctomycetota bacterium]
MPQRIAVLFGTETGNSQECADQLAKAIVDAGIQAESIDMAAYDPNHLGRESLVLIITSTFGNGDPPANAEALLRHVSDSTTSLAGVRFGVCALGDTTYPLFAQCGKDFDERLELRGAERVIERVDCDGGFDFFTEFEAFQEQCLEYLRMNGVPETSEPAQTKAAEVES